MKIKTNLSGLVSTNGRRTQSSPSSNAQIGKVYGIITTENTPNKELFIKFGGFNSVGTIFYLDYNQAKDTKTVNLNSCKVAKPAYGNSQGYPLIGELVSLIDAPSPVSQVNNLGFSKYYTGIINVWNNPQQNAPSGDTLGKTFIENADIRNLISFEGDTIYQGRKGNGLRFGSTVKYHSDLNEWSTIGNNGDPITILVNGYVTTDTGSLIPNVEEVNKELSSLYMTSTQKIPLTPGAIIKNPFISSLQPDHYYAPQIILNSDRVTINSKKDEVLVFAKKNIELSTDNILNLNAGEQIHLHINEKNLNSKILLGTGPNGEIPFEPVLLGGQTHDVLLEMCNILTTLAGFLSSAVVPTTEGGILIPGCNAAGEQLLADVSNLIDKLSTIQSNKVYTI